MKKSLLLKIYPDSVLREKSLPVTDIDETVYNYASLLEKYELRNALAELESRWKNPA